MSTISKTVALQIAQNKVNQLALAASDEFTILLEKTQNVEQGWVFFFNSSDFVQTGNPLSKLAGNGPILVSHSGEVHELPSSIPWEDALKLL